MKLVIRMAALLLLVVVFLFCIFGFLATFEPLDRSVQLTWRIVYVVAGAGALAGLVRMARRVATKPGIQGQPKEGAP